MEWVRRFILFHHKRRPQEIGSAEIEVFLTHLAVERHVAASMVRLRSPQAQNQALSG